MARHVTNEEKKKVDGTLISFDLRKVLTDEELIKFQQSAKEAGAPNLTEHFLNLTLRVPQKKAA